MPQPNRKKKQRLFVEHVDTVGLVDKGDDPEAQIVFLKAAPDGKRAETFSEVNDQDKLRSELWTVTDGIGSALRSALFDAEEDQDPEELILTSLDEFAVAVKAALPSWLKGQPYKKQKKEGGDGMDGAGKEPDRKTVRKFFEVIGQALGLEAGTVVVAEDGNDGEEGSTVEDVFKLEDLSEAAQKEFTRLTAEAAKVEDLTAKVEELTPKPEPKPEKVSVEVQKKLDDAETRAKDAEERIAKLEGEKRREEYVGKAADLSGIPGFNPDDHAETLDKIEAALGSEAFGKFFDVLKGAAAAVKTGELFRVMGTGEAPLGTVEQEVTEAVAEVRKAQPKLSVAQARAEVWKNNHALYDRYEKERSDRVRTAEGR